MFLGFVCVFPDRGLLGFFGFYLLPSLTLVIISSSVFAAPFFLSCPSGTPATHMLILLILSHSSLMLCSYLSLILFLLAPQIWLFLLIWFQVHWLLLPSSSSGGKSVPVLFYFRYFIFRSKISYCFIEISFFTSLSIVLIASLRSFSANYNIWVTSGLISCNHLSLEFWVTFSCSSFV